MQEKRGLHGILPTLHLSLSQPFPLYILSHCQQIYSVRWPSSDQEPQFTHEPAPVKLFLNWWEEIIQLLWLSFKLNTYDETRKHLCCNNCLVEQIFPPDRSNDIMIVIINSKSLGWQGQEKIQRITYYCTNTTWSIDLTCGTVIAHMQTQTNEHKKHMGGQTADNRKIHTPDISFLQKQKLHK